MTALLSLQDVWVRRGAATVLRGVSIEVGRGEIVSLLGSNGVGKSTTLRTISGLHRPYEGRIDLDGETISKASPQAIVQQGIAHVPEGRQVFPGLTVQENLELGAYGRPKGDAVDLDTVTDQFPVLKTIMSKPAGSLSGGQQQMLAIARGLAADPQVLLMDEPSLGLAPKIIGSIKEILLELKDRGLTVLLVEQNAALALAVSDRGYVLSHGTVKVAGRADELRDNPQVRGAYLGV